MNLFYLDENFEVNAQYHVDRHIIKQILEGCQILHTVFHTQEIDATYRPTHRHHPTTVWAGESRENFEWTIEYVMSLAKEYLYRYGKVHACMSPDVMGFVYKHIDKLQFEKSGMTPFALAMPDQYKTNDPVESYRNYYNGDKRHLFSWKNRETPYWINL